MKKSDKERLKKIISLWQALESEILQHQIDRKILMKDQFSQWAVTTPLYNIGEQVYQLSKEIKQQYPQMPWSVVAGLRHRLVHDDDELNWSIIADVVFDDMAPFIKEVRKILQDISVDEE